MQRLLFSKIFTSHLKWIYRASDSLLQRCQTSIKTEFNLYNTYRSSLLLYRVSVCPSIPATNYTYKFQLVPLTELEFKFDKRVARHRPCPQNPQTRFQAEPIRNSIIQVNFASVGVAQGLSDFFCFSFRSHFSPSLVSFSSPTNVSDAFSQV